MELEDKEKGDVIEGEDHVEIHGPFSVGLIISLEDSISSFCNEMMKLGWECNLKVFAL